MRRVAQRITRAVKYSTMITAVGLTVAVTPAYAENAYPYYCVTVYQPDGTPTEVCVPKPI